MTARGLKNTGAYRAVVCDMDGTLYFQAPMRAIMFLELLAYHCLRPWRAKNLMILRSFRKIRESDELVRSKNFDTEQYQITAKKYNTTPEHVCSLVELWMQKKPLKWIRFFRDKKLIDTLNGLRERGVKIIVFSDYPAEEKTKKIGLMADGVFSASDQKIGELKPSPKGLAVIAAQMSLNKNEMLMIGDRYEKDGLCAENFSIDWLLLSRGMISRAIRPAARSSQKNHRQ